MSLTQINMFYERTALFSADRVYRFMLRRIWDRARGLVLFIGLNPSVADETTDDATIRICTGYAKAWGRGGIYMANLFAWRATDPRDLLAAAHDGKDIIGAGNDRWLQEVHNKADLTIACWGNYGELFHRDQEVKKMLRPLYCLAVTAEGQPHHPLRLRKDLQPQLWN